MSSSTNKEESENYGYQDTSYRAAGELAGLRQLCIEFYKNMDSLPEAQKIRAMHEENLEPMIEKLSLFLTMWLGGPKTYREKYKFVGMPQAHKNFVINEPETEAWLLCMDRAIDQQNNYADSFKKYLKTQFRFPAELIRKTSRCN